MSNEIESVANQILYSYWNLTIPVNVYQIAENIGFNIVENQNEDNNAILNLNNKTIIINNNESHINNLSISYLISPNYFQQIKITTNYSSN